MRSFLVIPTVGGQPMFGEMTIEDAEAADPEDAFDEVAGRHYDNALIMEVRRYGPRPGDADPG